MSDEWQKDRKVIEAATPPPWEAGKIWPGDADGFIWGTDADIDFACRARTRWPAALDRIKELEAEREEAIAYGGAMQRRNERLKAEVEELKAAMQEFEARLVQGEQEPEG